MGLSRSFGIGEKRKSGPAPPVCELRMRSQKHKGKKKARRMHGQTEVGKENGTAGDEFPFQEGGKQGGGGLVNYLGGEPRKLGGGVLSLDHRKGTGASILLSISKAESNRRKKVEPSYFGQ